MGARVREAIRFMRAVARQDLIGRPGKFALKWWSAGLQGHHPEELIMAIIEIERQILPMFGSPNQGARFYNPGVAGDRAVRSRPPHLRRLRTVHSIPDDQQGVGRQHHPGRTDGMHVRREQLLPLHALQRAVGAHADRQRRQLHRGRGRRVRSHDPQRQVAGRVPEHYLRSGRRQRLGHRHRLDLWRALSQPRLPDHLL